MFEEFIVNPVHKMRENYYLEGIMDRISRGPHMCLSLSAVLSRTYAVATTKVADLDLHKQFMTAIANDDVKWVVPLLQAGRNKGDTK
jgi:hypothetical protein